METPWPKYPCHPCTTDHMQHARGPVHRGEDGWPVYGEASAYAWHSAKWDLITGQWDAVCCLGHRPRGRKRPEKEN